MAKQKSPRLLSGKVSPSKSIAFLIIGLVAILGVVVVFKSHAGGSGLSPVWALKNKQGKHIYTASQAEEQKLVASGYTLDSYNGTGIVDWSAQLGCCLYYSGTTYSYTPIYHWQNKQGVNRYVPSQPVKTDGSGYDYSYKNVGIAWYEPAPTNTGTKQVFEYTNGKDFVYIEAGTLDVGYFQGKGYKFNTWAFNSY
jgi:hypothetical protein